MPKKYRKEDIYVVWEPSKCINSEVCVRGLPSVFNCKIRPWIQVANADKEAIMEQVEQCPSGALSIEPVDKKAT